MTSFPQAVLGATVEVDLGSWTDITNYVFQRDPINIRYGRPDQSSQIAPAQYTMTLNNTDGRFSLNNPAGAYYGTLLRNTPLRSSVPNSLLPSPFNTTYMRLEDDSVSYASCPAASRIELTGSLDVRADIDLSGYGAMPLVSIWNASASVNQRCWFFGLNSNGTLTFSYTTDGTVATWDLNTVYTAPNSSLPIPMGRLCVRAVLSASAGTVTFYTAPAGSITSSTAWTQLGAPVTGLGSVTLFSSTSAPLTVGYSAGLTYDWANSEISVGVQSLLSTEGGLVAPYGAIYDVALYNASAALVAHPAFNAQSAGASSWTDSPGNTWTLNGTAALVDRCYRFHGELSELDKYADPSLTDVYAKATASGVMRRIQQGQTPLNSPFYRAYLRLNGTNFPNAYWPCEDGINASSLASPIAGVAPMAINGQAQLANNSNFVCSDALPVLNGSTWTGNVPVSAAAWTASYVNFLMQIPTGGDTAGTIISVYTTGTVARMDLLYSPSNSGELAFYLYNSAGTVITNTPGFQFLISYDGINNQNVVVDGALAEIDLQLTISGSTVTAEVVLLLVGSTSYAQVDLTVSTASIGAVTRVVVNPQGALKETVIGHVSVQQSTTVAASNSLLPALNAWIGETAGDRVRRLCAEEGIQSRIYGHSDLSVPMGYQTIETLQELLQECENTDQGLLFEPQTCVGVGYRTLNSLYNQTATATASFTSSAIAAGLSSTTDDLLTVNDVTASNIDGSSARQYLAAGPMSVQAPPNGIGSVNTEIETNAAYDALLAAVAMWKLHASTDAHDRLPMLPFNMARSQTPAQIALLRSGSLLAVTSPPFWIQPDEVDLLTVGFAETYGPFGVWEIDVNGIPAYPYVIGSCAPSVSMSASTAGSGPYATHVDTDGTTLTSGVTSTATAMSFTTVAGYPVWTTKQQNFPFDVNIAGERVTVVGPGVCLNADPFLKSGTADYTPGNGTISISAADGAPYAANGYATSAMVVTPAGSPATSAYVGGSVSSPGSVATSTGYTLWAWVYNAGGRTYELFANWFLNGAYVSTSTATGVAVTAGAWTLITGTVTSPSSGVTEMQPGVEDTASPASTNTFGVWGLNCCATSGIAASSPQGFTVARSVNGVVKAQSAGASVSMWFPPTCGL